MYASYPPSNARQLEILLRISADINIVGDVSVTVDNPAELLAWSGLLHEPTILAWRAIDSGKRYVHVSANSEHAPVRGYITAALKADQHREFWDELLPNDLSPGVDQTLLHADLSKAWQATPIAPPEV